jgi:hypothetical protein
MPRNQLCLPAFLRDALLCLLVGGKSGMPCLLLGNQCCPLSSLTSLQLPHPAAAVWHAAAAAAAAQCRGG